MTEQPRPPAFITAPPRRVGFVCLHNASRSQMAEGFARILAPADVEVWSAGTEPSKVHPMAVRVMAEVDIDLSGHASKSLDSVPWREADTIVTLCGESDEMCPAVGPLVRKVHWPLPDPSRASAAEAEQVFREVRDEIRWRVASLWPPGGI
jgi:arsenate reductase (thioredoxin)